MGDPVKSSNGSGARRIAIRLLQWYPRPWRMRYEHEMRALVEDMTVGWKQVGNLAITGVREWMSPRALGWPARSAAGRLWKRRFLTFLACAYSLDTVARVAGARVRSAGVEITWPIETAVTLIVVGMATRAFILFALQSGKRRWAIRARQRGWSTSISEWEVVLWAFLMTLPQVLFYAQTDLDYLNWTMLQLRPYFHLAQIYVWTWITLLLSTRTQRLSRVEASHLKRTLRPLGL